MAPDVLGAPRPVERFSSQRPELSSTAGSFPLYAFAVGAILALALLLRLRGITTFSFEQDEIYTMMEGRELFDTPLVPGIEARPLYFLLQHLLLDILPQTHFGLRVVPLLFGMAGVWVTGVLGSRVFGRTAGCAAAFLVAVAPWHIHASGFARYWSLVYLLGAIYALFLWESYRTDRLKHYLLALIPLILGSATHPSFIFAAFGASVGVSLIRNDAKFGLRWPSRVAWTGLWGPYLLFITAAFLALKLTGQSGALENWAGRGWLASLRLIPAIIEWLGPTIFAAGGLGALVALMQPAGDRRRWGAQSLCSWIIGFGLLLAASTRTDIYADYATALLPLIFVSAAGLIQVGVEFMRSRRAIALVLATLLLASSVLPATASHLSDGTRFDYRPAFDHIRTTAPKIPVLTWPGVLAHHYARDLPYHGLIMNTQALDSTLMANRDLWVIASIRRYGMVADDDGAVTRWLSRNCSLEFSHERSRWDYRLYRVAVHRCHAPT